MKKIIAIFLSLLVTFTAFGFTSGGSVPTDDTSNLNSASAYSNEIGKYEGENSQHYLIQNGVTEHVIVLPNDASSVLSNAAQELLLVFYESTGVKLQIVNEAAYSGSAAIYLGETAYKNQQEPLFDKQTLGDSGFRILTVDKNLIIYGNSDTGTLYGVYAFLTDVLNFEAFTSKYYYADKDVKEIQLKNYAVTDIPDIEYRISNNAWFANDKTLASRYRIVPTYDFFDSFGGDMFHTSFKVLPKAEYKDTHPKWYATDGLNLCYLARGDKAEYQKMLNTVFSELQSLIISNPEANHITFTHEDNQAWCKCDACSDLIAQYENANSVTNIYFMNDLKGLLDDWFAGDGAAYKRDVHLYFFAYHATNKPPVKKNATTGAYEPVDQTVILKEGVVPLFAESNNDYTHSYYEDECKSYAENYKGWKALSDEILMWAHTMNYSYAYTFFDNFSSSPMNYKFYVENNTFGLFEEASYNGHPTSLHVLRSWLFSKLSWDCTLNVNDLIDRFFTLYYRDAADEMLTFFNAYRQFSVIQKEELGYGGSRVVFYFALNNESLWPYRTLVQWYDIMQAALEKIQPLKVTDPTLYDALYDNITAERIAVIYPMLALWDAKFTDEELVTLREQIYEDFIRLGYTLTDQEYTTLGIER